MLELRSVASGYGEVRVLHGVSLRVERGERIALLGRNGMGKTTLLRTIIGHLPCRDGEVILAGRSVGRLPPYRRAWLGLGYVPQGRGLFPTLTVGENLYLGTKASNGKARSVPGFVFDYFPILRERSAQLAGTLSGGEQQQLAIARALVSDPAFLLLDEPSEGIQPNLVAQIGDDLRRIADDRRVGILLVEQNLDMALHVAERCLVLEGGRIVHEGPSSSLTDDRLIRQILAV